MVLHRANFEIPARFDFQPYSAKWRCASAEILEWVEERKLMAIRSRQSDDPEKNWLRVRIDALPYGSLEEPYGIDFSCHTVHMDRASIPPDVLLAHENHRNTPDVSDRCFDVLIFRMPEIKDTFWTLEPGKVKKNAWAMRDEFMSLEADQDPELGWNWSVVRFLNKWGIWELSKGYTEDWTANLSTISPPHLSANRSLPLRELMTTQTPEKPDFLLVVPHLLKKLQEKYRKALLPTSRTSWLRSHRLEHVTADDYPFIRVQRSNCSAAIEATITIDHIAGLNFGICERCHKVFEKETQHKKNYCSRRCIQAAGVKRWRAKQKLEAKRSKNAKRKN
jgi:hypothetical protein